MSKLNNDIIYLIFKELQYDKKTIRSCLTVNRFCCEIIIPILWKNPWNYLKKEREASLLSVIVSHLSEESKNNLRSQGIHFFSYQKPSFNYIRYCTHLNLDEICKIIHTIYCIHEKSKLSLFKNEIFNLFINENTKFTHLYIPREFDFQLHLIPGAKCCFSELEFLHCNTS